MSCKVQASWWSIDKLFFIYHYRVTRNVSFPSGKTLIKILQSHDGMVEGYPGNVSVQLLTDEALSKSRAFTFFSGTLMVKRIERRNVSTNPLRDDTVIQLKWQNPQMQMKCRWSWDCGSFERRDMSGQSKIVILKFPWVYGNRSFLSSWDWSYKVDLCEFAWRKCDPMVRRSPSALGNSLEQIYEQFEMLLDRWSWLFRSFNSKKNS